MTSVLDKYAFQSVSDVPEAINKFTSFAFHQQQFLEKVTQKRYNSKFEIEDEIDNLEEEDLDFTPVIIEKNRDFRGPRKDTEIIDLHQTFLHTLKNRILRNAETQTDPVKDEAFDWDLSDKTDIETQTVPPSRTNSAEERKSLSKSNVDEIVQTDQRLVFLLRRSTADKKTGKSKTRVTYHDASCQTHIEVQEIGVQVSPSEFELSDSQRQSQSETISPDLASPDNSRKVLTAVRKRLAESESIASGILQFDSDYENDVFSSQSDAGFQVNLAADAEIAVAEVSNRADISSPVGTVLQKSLHFVEPYSSTRTPASSATKIKIAPYWQGAKPKKLTRKVTKVDIGIQTENDIITDESPSFKAVPSTLRKYEVIGDDPDLFCDIDNWVLEVSKKRYKSLKKIVKILLSRVEEENSDRYSGKEDLIKIRAFFRWVTENIEYDVNYIDTHMTTHDILRERKGVCRQYVKLFGDMCELSQIRVKNIKGFAKGPHYMPGNDFVPGESVSHAWNAVFISGSWRLLDCTWGAGRVDPNGVFTKELNEHYFLTDPDELIFTHFPYDEVEANYSRWQLLTHTVSLATFNTMPCLKPMFFEYSLRLGKEMDPMSPIIIRGDIKKKGEGDSEEYLEIKIWAWEVIRYKYKFFKATEEENDNLNKYVLCYLKGKQRKLAVFRISPPETESFYLKIYAKPEEEIADEHDTLDHVATLLIHGVQISFTPMAFPRSDLPWGVTEAFQKTEAQLVGLTEPFIHMVGDKEAKVTLRTSKSRILSVAHIYDSEGNEVVIDKDQDVKYTVVLNKTSFPGSITDEMEETTIQPFISKKECDTETQFIVGPLPKPGYYKLQIFARKRPQKRGKIKLPLVASFMVDYHQSKNKEQTKFQGSSLQQSASRKITTLTSVLSNGSSSLLRNSLDRGLSSSRKSETTSEQNKDVSTVRT